MSTQIGLNKSTFLDKLLFPLSKFTDNVILNLKHDSIECIASSSVEAKQNTIFYCSLKINTTGIKPDETIILNIMGIKRLIYAIGCVKSTDITLEIHSNHLLYNQNGTTFKFHLKEDGLIEKPAISVDKMNKLTFDFSAELTMSSISDLLKGSNFCNSASSKIYLYVKDGVLFGEVTDKSIQNLDTINVELSASTTGKPFDGLIPVTIDLFRLISGIKTESLTLKINVERKILLFEVQDQSVSLKYIASTLVQ